MPVNEFFNIVKNNSFILNSFLYLNIILTLIYLL